MHGSDSPVLLSGVDTLYFVLQACSENLRMERAASLTSTVFTEKVSHSWCASVSSLASKYWRSIPSNLLWASCRILQTSTCQSSVLGSCWRKKKPWLIRLSNHLTGMLINAGSGNKRSTRLGLAATMALGQLLQLRGALARLAAAKSIIASLLSSVHEGVGFEKFRWERLEFLKSKEIFSSLELDVVISRGTSEIDLLTLADCLFPERLPIMPLIGAEPEPTLTRELIDQCLELWNKCPKRRPAEWQSCNLAFFVRSPEARRGH